MNDSQLSDEEMDELQRDYHRKLAAKKRENDRRAEDRAQRIAISK